MTLMAPAEKGSDDNILREMIGLDAERLPGRPAAAAGLNDRRKRCHRAMDLWPFPRSPME
jgi:hypothetical protein